MAGKDEKTDIPQKYEAKVGKEEKPDDQAEEAEIRRQEQEKLNDRDAKKAMRYGATPDHPVEVKAESVKAEPSPPPPPVAQPWSVGQIIFILVICGLYIVASATLIMFNKFLMHKDRFPYAWVLTGWHIVVTFSCCAFMYIICPSIFPSAMAARQHRNFVTQWFPCIAILFTFGAVFSNIAYLHCSVSFLQFMKEWNIGFVFVMACVIGTQTADRVKVAVIIWIIAFASVSVTGDKEFSKYGFMIQLASQFCETTKAVFQEWLMGGKLKLDPLTYQLCMCPFAFVPLAVGVVVAWDPEIEHLAIAWWPYILANGFCAFLLNVSVAAIIKYAGAIGFLLAAIVKDICIVVLATHLNHEVLQTQQIVGFVFALFGILYWGLLTATPTSRLVTWLPTLLGMPVAAKEKAIPDSGKENPSKGKDLGERCRLISITSQ